MKECGQRYCREILNKLSPLNIFDRITKYADREALPDCVECIHVHLSETQKQRQRQNQIRRISLVGRIQQCHSRGRQDQKHQLRRSSYSYASFAQGDKSDFGIESRSIFYAVVTVVVRFVIHSDVIAKTCNKGATENNN